MPKVIAGLKHSSMYLSLESTFYRKVAVSKSASVLECTTFQGREKAFPPYETVIFSARKIAIATPDVPHFLCSRKAVEVIC